MQNKKINPPALDTMPQMSSVHVIVLHLLIVHRVRQGTGSTFVFLSAISICDWIWFKFSCDGIVDEHSYDNTVFHDGAFGIMAIHKILSR